MAYLTIIINYIILLYIYQSKTIVFPFKKLTIESFSTQKKTINDLFSYNIYTNISMGTPLRQVGHFIVQTNDFFYYKSLQLSFNNYKYNETFEKIISNKTNFWYNNDNSSTFTCLNEYYSIYSDYFHFQYLNGSTIEINLPFNIHALHYKYKYGTISLKNPINPDYKHEMYFIPEIKMKELIDGYYFTILYEDNNNLFNYNDNIFLGKLLIGESPHQFNPEKYKEDEEVINPGNEFYLFINKVKFYSDKLNYTEENIKIQFSFVKGFIQGSIAYMNNIEKIFFEELINKNLCFKEYLDDNIYISKHLVFSCINNDEIRKKIEYFPTLFFEIKTNNLTFMFTYKDLFKAFDDKLYFLINFRPPTDINYTYWTMSDIFLRKYITSFK